MERILLRRTNCHDNVVHRVCGKRQDAVRNRFTASHAILFLLPFLHSLKSARVWYNSRFNRRNDKHTFFHEARYAIFCFVPFIRPFRLLRWRFACRIDLSRWYRLGHAHTNTIARPLDIVVGRTMARANRLIYSLTANENWLFIAGETRAVCRAFMVHRSNADRHTHVAIVPTNSIKSDFRELNLTIAHDFYTNVRWEAPAAPRRRTRCQPAKKCKIRDINAKFNIHTAQTKWLVVYILVFFIIIISHSHVWQCIAIVVMCACVCVCVRGTATIFSHFIMFFSLAAAIRVNAVRPVVCAHKNIKNSFHPNVRTRQSAFSFGSHRFTRINDARCTIGEWERPYGKHLFPSDS